MKLSGMFMTRLPYKHHTVMAPQHPMWQNDKKNELMLYMLSQDNVTEWSVRDGTILQASHHNGSTTPPVPKWPRIEPSGNLNGCHAVTT